MTIERLLYDISQIALKNNLVNASYAGPSIYNINGGTVVDYPYVFTSPTDDITVSENVTTYGLTLYYVDRLLEDNANEVDVFSTGVETIKNLLRQLANLDEIVRITDQPTIRLFTETQRMADSCAGAYVRFELTALNTAACPTYFDETGAPLGTYIPTIIKDQSVLDNLASKNWVVQYVAEHGGGSGSGGTDERRVQQMIDASLEYYTRTENFATINGSGITSGQTFSLVEWDEFNEYVTQFAEDLARLSGVTAGDFEALSAKTEGIAEDLAELSGTTADFISSTNSGITELSGATASQGRDLADLSGFTASAVTRIDKTLETLSGATETALAGKQDKLVAGTGITIENNVISALDLYGNVRSESVFTLVDISQEDYDLLATKDPHTLYIITN